MINSLELKCFRKHEDTQIDFASGLNVIRGRNEIGKTTLIEAILYTLFGSTVLRESLDQVVTWGHKESELSSKSVISIQGTTYTFSRSKKGAECNWTGGKVTGQKEVSAFAAELLGADAKTSAMLMMASQSDLRGALDDGPGAVSGLMSKLADFQVIDRILETASQKLLLGSEQPILAKLMLSEDELAAAELVPDMADQLIELGEAVDTAKAALATREGQAELSTKALALAEQQLNEAVNVNNARSQGLLEVDRIAARASREQTSLDLAKAQASTRPAPEAIDAARAAVQRANEHAAVVKAYQAFMAVPAYPGVAWDEDAASFAAAVNNATDGLNSVNAEFDTFSREIEEHKRHVMTDGKCKACGHAAHDEAFIAEHNKKIADAVAALGVNLIVLSEKRSEIQAEIGAYRSINESARVRWSALSKISGAYFDLDEAVFPPKAAWVGAAPAATADSSAKPALDALLAAERAATLADGRIEAHTAALVQLDIDRANQVKAVEAIVAVELTGLEREVNEARESYDLNFTHLVANRMKLSEAVAAEAEARTVAAQRSSRIAAAQARIAEYSADLRTLAFNNSLVKRLKEIRPLITDHLWQIVLSAVSNYFTAMRGETSVVTKDGSGFLVNGKGAKGLSGSTLDVLALAIRVGLSKTFVPHASFMILDEPGSGCDSDRTGNLLGFLQGSGFDQTILASHDSLSEAIADHVINLGD